MRKRLELENGDLHVGPYRKKNFYPILIEGDINGDGERFKKVFLPCATINSIYA